MDPEASLEVTDHGTNPRQCGGFTNINNEYIVVVATLDIGEPVARKPHVIHF